ncbi:amidohydrolase family protein [Microbacterium sp. MYb62]|uniref:amidohydrolase family protein n=1 Tax=Microbacterium sp. MYb62 TaxID=1848690 RepID=UPI000CFBD3B5|nr:amidohydrolase family protein [Microbacterium sp. MYb62]PRB09819.1 hypothetical protein CQ042_18845 [Microbacterium sp. MYb62]
MMKPLPTTSTLFTGATVLTNRVAGTVERNVDVLIEEGVIARIGEGIVAADARVIDAQRAILAPGLVDTHMHAWQYPWRGAAQRKWGFDPYFALLQKMRHAYSPEDTRIAVSAASLALLRQGVTGIIDFVHGAHSTSDHVASVLAAHRATGLRAVVHPSTGATSDHTPTEIAEAQKRRFDDIDTLAAGIGPGDRVQVGLALMMPTPEVWEDVAAEIEFARDRGLRMTFHQNRPGDVTDMMRLGVVGSDIVAAHANSLADEEMRAMAECGMPVAFTPRTEVSDVRRTDVILRAFELGVTVGFGVDTPVYLPLDLRGELETAFNLMQLALGQRVRYAARVPLDVGLDPQRFGIDDIARAATVGGNRALGRGGAAGEVTVGAPADLVLYRPFDPDPALSDPAAFLVLGAGHASEVDTVMVDGDVVIEGGRFQGDLDVEELAARGAELRRRCLSTLGSSLDSLLPA